MSMKVKISKVKSNKDNPRLIKDNHYNKLVRSIEEFPEMLEKRPVVCFTDKDNKYVVLGGNMRLKASIEAGLKEIPIILADDWTEKQKKEFIIKDNISSGIWDWDMLANEWNAENLNSWGLEVWQPEDLTEKNKEIDIDSLDQTMTLKLNFSEEEYWKVKNELLKISNTPEDAILKLLKI